jgi:branched-chain amino acid transport system permease protein
MIIFSFFVPLLSRDIVLLRSITLASVSAIFAASWDLLAGYCGQPNFGHAFAFGLGAYGTALLYNLYGLSPWIAIPVNFLIVCLISMIIGFPLLRVRGPYFSLMSMIFPQIATSIILLFKDVTRADRGLPCPTFFPFLTISERRIAEYYMALLSLLVSGIIMYKIANSLRGKIFISILDDELASQSCGINITKYKIQALIISNCFACLAGSLYASIVNLASLWTFSLTLSFYPVIWTVFGGMQTIYGAIMGAIVLETLDRYILTVVVPIPQDWHMIIFSIPIVIFIIKWRFGFVRLIVEAVKNISGKTSVAKESHGG